MVISSFISSILVLAIGIWAYLRLESSMNSFAEKQLLIEPSKFSYKMWKDMPVTMYQSFTFFNLTNWNQVKSIGQKPRFVEVGPYVYRTVWSKSDINFLDEDRLISFAEKKQWHFQAHLSHGQEDDQIWTINTPLMTALALIQNAPVITRNIVSVILDGLGEGAFIKRPIRGLLFEGYSDLIVSVGPLFDRRFANFNGKFAYLYNKNDTVDGIWTVSTGLDDLASLNKITRFQSSIVNMTSHSSGQMPQGLNEVKSDCAPAWSLDHSTNGQLFAPFNRDAEQLRLQQQLQQLNARSRALAEHPPPSSSGPLAAHRPADSIVQAPKRFFSRSASQQQQQQHQQQQQAFNENNQNNNRNLQHQQQLIASVQDQLQHLKDIGKFIFYPDLCRPLHLLPSKQEIESENGIKASRYFIDPRVFMNSSQVPSNKCYEMNPRPPLANALAATINSVTGANVNVPNLVSSGSSPFSMFIPPTSHHHHHHGGDLAPNHLGVGGLFERSNHHPSSFLNNALQSLSATANQAADQLAASSSNNTPIGRLGRVRQLFSNIVSQRMSGASPLLPSLTAGPASLLMGGSGAGHHQHQIGASPTGSSQARNAPDFPLANAASNLLMGRQTAGGPIGASKEPSVGLQNANTNSNLDPLMQLQAENNNNVSPIGGGLAAPGPGLGNSAPTGGSDRWITQFRFKWPRGVFSIGQCQLGAPIYVSLPHFLDADEYYLEQVDGLRPNRSLHEFYIDVESTLHAIPVNAKARLQLNVATPELRFRNIPNAMIPVLWQEVTFKMDKPVASMLYWSFTMSSTIYKLIAVSVLLLGTTLLVWSFVSGFKRHGRAGRPTQVASHRSSHRDSTSSSTLSSGASPGRRPSRSASRTGSQSSGSSSSFTHPSFLATRPELMRRATSGSVAKEGQPSSWKSRMIIAPVAGAVAAPRSGLEAIVNSIKHCNTKQQSVVAPADSLDELHHGGAMNYGFGSCHELQHDRQSSNSGPPSSGTNLGSPKQPWSRASSHCELVPSLPSGSTGAPTGRLTVNCTGCLFACMRHLPHDTTTVNNTVSSQCGLQSFNNHHHHHHHHDHANCIHEIEHQHQRHTMNQTTGDRSLVVRQQTLTTTSDTDKATLSSRGSNLDSCGS